MSNRAVSGLVAILTATILGGCVVAPTKTDQTTHASHADVVYQQFVLTADGKMPYDLASLGQVAGECGATSAPRAPPAGGVAILGTVLGAAIGEMAKAVVTELQKLVDAEIANYSSDIVGKPTRLGFYAPKLWFHKKGGSSEQYSCFLVALNACAASTVDKVKGVCPYTPGNQARVLVIGQYKLSREDLQVRPLYARIMGFEAKRNTAEKQASIAITLKFESVWWDGQEGHGDAPRTADVIAMRFVPTPGDDHDPGVDLPIEHKDPSTPGGYAFADWETRPLLPRPPRSPGSDGTLTVTPEVAETNSPPEGLALVKNVLGSNSTQISSALQSALTSLCGKTCASQSGSGK